MSNRTQDSQRDDDKQRHMNSEDRHIENDKRKNHFENEQDQQDHASEQIHPEQKQASHSLHYSDDATEDDKQDDDVKINIYLRIQFMNLLILILKKDV